MLGLESKYAYATGRVRALETRLLDRGRIERMIDAPDLEDALKVLAEAGYAKVSERGHATVDAVIADEEERLIALVRETSPDPELVELVTARRDFHNLKVMLKSKLYGVSPTTALVAPGALSVEAIDRAVDGEVRDLAPDFALALEAANAAHAGRPSPDSIDMAIDRGMYRFLLAKAGSLRIAYAIELLKAEIDLLNLAIFFRARKAGREGAHIEEAFVPGGKMEVGLFTAAYGQPLEILLREASGTGYAPLVQKAIEMLEGGRSLSGLERLSQAAMNDVIRRARLVPLGPEPLIGYMFAKAHELRLVRSVLAGKASGMSRDTIRERLRDTYV